MQPLEPEAESLLREWIEKADADLEVARRLAAEAGDNFRIREIVGFHCQQAAAKYLKALLTRRQVADSVRRGDSLSGRHRRDAAWR